MNIQDRFTVTTREVLHKNVPDSGPRIGKVQTVLDRETGKATTVNFWYDSNGRLLWVK